MTKYPLRGSGIEVHAVPENSIEDKRQFDIYVDERLFIMLRQPDQWKTDDTGRKTLNYDGTSSSTTETRQPLRGEGIEIRQLEQKPGDWRQYRIDVDPQLRTRFIADKIIEDETNETSTSHHVGAKGEPTSAARPEAGSPAPPAAKEDRNTRSPETASGDDVRNSENDQGGWHRKGDAYAIAYFVSDKGFAPATPVTKCVG